MNLRRGLYQDRGSAAQTRIGTAEKFAASLPGNNTKTQNADIHSVTGDLKRLRLFFNRKLEFHIDSESREVIVKVVDSETDKVIKELPPEELQRLRACLREAVGFLFDKQA